MKMLKLLFRVFWLLLFLLIFGCSTQQECERINSDDEKKLLAFAATIIRDMPNTNVTQTEKEAILKEKPTVSINYTGNKTGRYSVSWVIGQKTITLTGNGDITSPESSFDEVNIISVCTN